MSNKYYDEAGYGKRIGAYLIDSLFFLAFFLLFIRFFSENQNVFLIGFVFLQLLLRLYFILMNKYCRGTLGKKIFKLEIINFNEEKADDKLSWKTVLLRQLLDIITVIPEIIIPIISVILIDNWQGYQTFSLALRAYKASPLGFSFIIISSIITLAEIIILIINEENRSLHDLIAGTVVIENL